MYLCSSVFSRPYSLSGGRQCRRRAYDLAVKVEGPVSCLPFVRKCLEPVLYKRFTGSNELLVYAIDS